MTTRFGKAARSTARRSTGVGMGRLLAWLASIDAGPSAWRSAKEAEHWRFKSSRGERGRGRLTDGARLRATRPPAQGWWTTVRASSGAQHSASLKAITARQLQALVRRPPRLWPDKRTLCRNILPAAISLEGNANVAGPAGKDWESHR